MADWHLYLVRTADGALYTGVATDVARRLAAHQRGGADAAKYLRSRGPLELVYAARVGSRALALRVEARVKQLSKADKEAIVARCLGIEELSAVLGIASPERGGDKGRGPSQKAKRSPP